LSSTSTIHRFTSAVSHGALGAHLRRRPHRDVQFVLRTRADRFQDQGVLIGLHRSTLKSLAYSVPTLQRALNGERHPVFQVEFEVHQRHEFFAKYHPQPSSCTCRPCSRGPGPMRVSEQTQHGHSKTEELHRGQHRHYERNQQRHFPSHRTKAQTNKEVIAASVKPSGKSGPCRLSTSTSENYRTILGATGRSRTNPHCVVCTDVKEPSMSSALKEKPCAEDLRISGAAGMILDGRYLPPPEDQDGKLWVRTSALI
jgi:hypothetical protein